MNGYKCAFVAGFLSKLHSVYFAKIKLWRRKADQKKMAFHKPSLGVSWPRILGVFHKVKSIYSYLQNARPRTRSMERCQHPRFCLHNFQLEGQNLSRSCFGELLQHPFKLLYHWRPLAEYANCTQIYSGLFRFESAG